MAAPFFSIIVTTLNAEEFIERTLRSVLEQTDGDYEIIIKDGGSSDGTLSRIPQHEKITVYSLPDGGIYEGMNQGIAHASGRYLYFLNCGDTLHNEHVLEQVHALALQEGGRDELIIYGDFVTGGFLHTLPKSMSKFFLFGSSICHQAMFFGRKVFERYGSYDTALRLMADYDLTLKAFMGGSAFIHCAIPVCHYLGGGFSARKEQRTAFHAEHRCLRQRHFSRWERAGYALCRILTAARLRSCLKALRQRLCRPQQCP